MCPTGCRHKHAATEQCFCLQRGVRRRGASRVPAPASLRASQHQTSKLLPQLTLTQDRKGVRNLAGHLPTSSSPKGPWPQTAQDVDLGQSAYQRLQGLPRPSKTAGCAGDVRSSHSVYISKSAYRYLADAAVGLGGHQWFFHGC